MGCPPAARPGALWALAARTGLPEGPVAAAARGLPGRHASRSRRLVDEVERRWDELSEGALALPSAPPRITVLAMMRSAALTIFLFGDGPRPLLVLKVPKEGNRAGRARARVTAPGPRQRRGAAAAGAGGGGPRPGGHWRACRFAWRRSRRQGRPAWPGRPRWNRSPRAWRAWGPRPHARGRRRSWPRWWRARSPIRRLGERARRTLAAAWRDIRTVPDVRAAPQRHLAAELPARRRAAERDRGLGAGRAARGARLRRLEPRARLHGVRRRAHPLVPGAGVRGLSRSWPDSGFWQEARQAARNAALAGGAREQDLDALEICFFGSRIGNRLERPGWHPTSAATVARALEEVCAGL